MCKKNLKKSISDAAKQEFIKGTSSNNDCSNLNFFKAFNETLISASVFHYNVDVELINISYPKS